MMLHSGIQPSTLDVNTAAAVGSAVNRAEKVIRLNALIALVDDPAVIAALNTELETVKRAVEEAITRAINLDSRSLAKSAA